MSNTLSRLVISKTSLTLFLSSQNFRFPPLSFVSFRKKTVAARTRDDMKSRFLKLTKEKGGNLKFCELKNKVREVFEITNLDKVFEIYPTESAALAAVHGK